MKADRTIRLLTAIMWTCLGLAAATMFSYIWFPQEAAWRMMLVPILLLTQIFAKVLRTGFQHEMGIRR